MSGVWNVGPQNFGVGDLGGVVEILAWVAWVHKILAWVGVGGIDQKNGMGLNVLLFNHTL